MELKQRPGWVTTNEIYSKGVLDGENCYLDPDGRMPLYGPETMSLVGQMPCNTRFRIYEREAPANQIIDGIEYKLVPVEG